MAPKVIISEFIFAVRTTFPTKIPERTIKARYASLIVMRQKSSSWSTSTRIEESPSDTLLSENRFVDVDELGDDILMDITMRYDDWKNH